MTLQEFEQTCRSVGVESVQIQLRGRFERSHAEKTDPKRIVPHGWTVDAIAFRSDETTFATYGEQSIETALTTIATRIKGAL